jgi:hypothetical protein
MKPKNNLSIYIKYVTRLAKAVEDYHTATKTSEDNMLDALQVISDLAENLTADSFHEYNTLDTKLKDEALVNERDEAEAYKGQY